MWLRGNKHFPAFTYGLATKRGRRGLTDVVSYEKKGKTHFIKGFDLPSDTNATAFTWRGKGLLGLFESKWRIVFRHNDWMLIHFEKTLATPEGYDVISRDKALSNKQRVFIAVKLHELNINGLQAIPQQ